MELDNTFSQEHPFTAFNTETKTPGYRLLNMGTGFNLVNKKGKLVCSFHVSGNNLTDLAYQNHLSRLKYADLNLSNQRTGVFNMGRNYNLKFILPLSISLQ
jgi:iron complex outermembrane recepter protein